MRNISGRASPEQRKGVSPPWLAAKSQEGKIIYEQRTFLAPNHSMPTACGWQTAKGSAQFISPTDPHTLGFRGVPLATGRGRLPASQVTPRQSTARPATSQEEQVFGLFRCSVAALVARQDVQVAVCHGIIRGSALQNNVSVAERRKRREELWATHSAQAACANRWRSCPCSLCCCCPVGVQPTSVTGSKAPDYT